MNLAQPNRLQPSPQSRLHLPSNVPTPKRRRRASPPTSRPRSHSHTAVARKADRPRGLWPLPRGLRRSCPSPEGRGGLLAPVFLPPVVPGLGRLRRSIGQGSGDCKHVACQFRGCLQAVGHRQCSCQLETKKVSMASGADRISALPDELLHHVMSFLPMHEVVCMSLLARRWLDLWKSAPAMRVTAVKDCDNPRWFINYVNILLLSRHSGARLDSFNLNLDECDFSFKPFLPTYGTDVNMWFRIALLSQARVISLHTSLGIYDENWDLPLELLNVPIISQHLKVLDLQRVTLKRSTPDFSGCRMLVNLKMKECDISGNVSSPFLKHLSIISCYFATRSFRARIYMPGLISLFFSECFRRTPLLENMPLLVSAIVRVKDTEDECSKSTYGDCGDHTCMGCYDFDHGANDRHGECLLLKGISQVTELELSVDSTVFIVNRDLKLCPTFCKLKTLFLSAWCPGVAADRNMLTCFLQHSPILEKLVLQLPKVPKDQVGTESSYKRSEQSFICSHLKIVDIKCEEVDGRVQETLEILSTYYGIPLEHVNIQQTDIMASGP